MTIILRALTSDDCEQVRRWRNADLSPWRTPHLLTEEMQADFYRNVVCDRNAPHRFWAVDDGARLVGMVGCTNIQWENRLCEVNLIMDPVLMRLADMAVDLLLEQAFDFLGLATVCGECYTCSPMLEFWCAVTHRYDCFVTNLPRRKFWQGEFRDSLFFSIFPGMYERERMKRRA